MYWNPKQCGRRSFIGDQKPVALSRASLTREFPIDRFEEAAKIVQVNAKASRGRVAHEHCVSHVQAISVAFDGMGDPGRGLKTA